MTVEPGFEHVAKSFAEAIQIGGGGALAVEVNGVVTLDVVAGSLPDERPWEASTPCLIFSGTKGLVAAAVNLLIGRGKISLGTRLVEFWPEFGSGGKAEVTVGHVLAHTAGLPGVAVEDFDVSDQVALAALLAASPPLTPIGLPTYHALTFGTLCDAIIRRVEGRSAGRFVADEICAPLGLEVWIGAPASVVERAAVPYQAADFQLAADLAPSPDPRLRFVYGGLARDWSQLLSVEIPAANAVATARSLARFYSSLINGGLGLEPATLRRELSAGPDVLSGRQLRFGAGFELTGTPSFLGPVSDAFGFTGSGGSTHGVWPSRGVSFSFCMTEMQPENTDRRASSILESLELATR